MVSMPRSLNSNLILGFWNIQKELLLPDIKPRIDFLIDLIIDFSYFFEQQNFIRIVLAKR